ncbi:PAS domain-containing protein [Parvularcula sp. LCG005]|uniref:PAS domain-containing protein n=1 Tax=Parvularcula sp. LCG005 TaxID=3078805 RepID=UPI002943E6FE|nr:PAS domain-containing protein [Parvularcula sp. LCG005]WOI54100.1 PAS domain-containing protein [Parvularcula sp. LCG005]
MGVMGNKEAKPNALAGMMKSRFERSYALAIFLIIFITIASELVVHHELRQDLDATEMVNISGRQRLLSQRTLALAEQLHAAPEAPPEVVALFETTLDRIESSDALLRRHVDEQKMSAIDREAFRSAFDDAERGAGPLWADFISAAKSAAAGQSTDDDINAMRSLAYGPLLKTLDDIVMMFERRADARIQRIGRIHQWQTIGTLLILLAEVIFIFKPILDMLLRNMRDLEQKKAAATHSTFRIQTALEGSSVGLWETDLDSGQTSWSPLINDILGLPHDYVLTRDEFIRRVHREDLKDALSYQQQLKEADGPFGVTIRLRHEDDSWIKLEIQGSMIDLLHADFPDEHLIAGSFRNVTAEHAAQDTKDRVWSVLVDNSLEFNEKCRRILSLVNEHYGLHVGIISKIRGDTYSVLHAITPDDSLQPGQRFDFANTYCFHVCQATGPLAFHHVGESEIREHPCYRSFGLEAYIGAPLFVRGAQYGTINFSSPEVRNRPFTQEDLTLIDLIARWIGYEIGMQKNVEDIAEKEERFALALAGSSVGIWDWINVSEEEQIWSDRLYQLLGYDRDVIASTRSAFFDLIHPDDVQATLKALEQHLVGRTPYHQEYRLRMADGSYRWFLGTGQAVWDANGTAVRMIGSLMDINERKTEEENRAQFISTVSHELRTPMTSILGSLQLVRSGKIGVVDASVDNLLRITQTSSERLLRLINDILDLEKISSDHKGMRTSKLDIAPLLVEAVEQNQAFAQKHEATIKLVPPTEDLVIFGDHDRVFQVLINLISNAVKFSSDVDGQVELTAYSRPGQVLIDVKDNGQGIPANNLDRIFGRFMQLENNSDKNISGTGLGLAICKEIMLAHQGDVTVQSRVGMGTTMTLHFPMYTELDADKSVPAHEVG